MSKDQLSKKTGTIFNIMRYCIHDGPGIRTTVFFKGCPLQCWWCHNPEGLKSQKEVFYHADKCLQCGDCLEVCPHHAIENRGGLFITVDGECHLTGKCADVCSSEARRIVGRDVTVDEVMKEIEKDVVFYDESSGGVTFSGGEPLMQPSFLEELLKYCKNGGIHTAVDTSGYASPEIFEKICQYTDLFLYDLKTVDDKTHREHTGASNELIMENLKIITSRQSKVVIRLPVIPGVNDDRKSILDIGQFVSSLRNIEEIDILPYHETGIEKYKRFGLQYRKPQTDSISRDKLDGIQEDLKRLGMQITIRE